VHAAATRCCCWQCLPDPDPRPVLHRQETTPTTIWDVREMAADGLAFVDVPDGWLNTEVVPYDLTAGTVRKSATVAHLSNKYCNGKDMAWCFIRFDKFIHT